MAYAKGNGEFVESDDRWISVAPFETTNVLLAEAREMGELLLCQALFLPEPPDVLPDEPAHIHAQEIIGLHTSSLSTILCPRYIASGQAKRFLGWRWMGQFLLDLT
jgi:hypothetical protein